MAFYAGLDVHKEHINAAIVDNNGNIVREEARKKKGQNKNEKQI